MLVTVALTNLYLFPPRSVQDPKVLSVESGNIMLYTMLFVDTDILLFPLSPQLLFERWGPALDETILCCPVYMIFIISG